MSFDKSVHTFLEMQPCSTSPPHPLPLAVGSTASRQRAMWKRAGNSGNLESAHSLLNGEGATSVNCCHEGPVLSVLWIFHEMLEIPRL